MATDSDKTGPPRVQIANKKAFRNFEITEKYEAGIALLGTEVKSLRAKQAELDGAYARIIAGQCWLVGCKISPYAQASIHNHQPERRRKLLLHKQQIRKITTKLEQRGFTLVPLRIYFNQRGLAKVELGLARGKRKYDKRAQIEKRDQKRDLARSMKSYQQKKK
jgi:SsrA-binding protein